MNYIAKIIRTGFEPMGIDITIKQASIIGLCRIINILILAVAILAIGFIIIGIGWLFGKFGLQ